MNRVLQSLLIVIFVTFATAYSCSQQGPTTASVQLTWTNVAQPAGVTATGNCIYRGTASGTYTLPALFCSPTPTTTYVDNTPAASQTYWYAVTTKAGAAESAYSIPVQAVIPANPNAPTGLAAPTITKNEMPNKDGVNLTAKVYWHEVVTTVTSTAVSTPQ